MNRNKNRIRKLTDFKRRELCICPSSNLYWKIELNLKYLKREPRKMTRQYAKEIRQNMDKKL